MKVVSLTKAALAAGALFVALSAIAQNDRVRYGVSFDSGQTFESLSFAKGGFPTLNFATTDGDGSVLKTLTGGVSPAPFTLQVGAGNNGGMLGWVAETFKQEFGPIQSTRHLVIAARDQFGNAQLSDCTGATISEVDFPALDASSKDAAKMRIKLDPADCKQVAVNVNPRSLPRQQYFFSERTFAWQISGIDPRTNVTNINAVRVKYGASFGTTGIPQRFQDDSLVEMTIPVTQGGPFQQWLSDSAKSASQGLNDERQGSITYFDTAGNQIGTLVLNGLGIISIAPADLDGDGDSVVKVVMYVQSVQFNVAQ